MNTPTFNASIFVSVVFAFIIAVPLGTGCSRREAMKKEPYSKNGLCYAARDGRIERVRKAIASGTDVNCTDDEGASPLLLASFSGHTEVVKVLLDAGANVNQRDAKERSALMYAASDENLETIEVLLNAKIDIDATERTEGFTALMFAAAEGQFKATQMLLKAGANTELADIDGDTAESFAAKAGHHAVVALFSDVDAPAPEKITGNPVPPPTEPASQDTPDADDPKKRTSTKE